MTVCAEAEAFAAAIGARRRRQMHGHAADDYYVALFAESAAGGARAGSPDFRAIIDLQARSMISW